MRFGGIRKVAIGLAALLLGGVVGGCASVQVHPVAVAQLNNPSIKGVRFFQPAPYLLVTEVPAMAPGPHPMMPPLGKGEHRAWKHHHKMMRCHPGKRPMPPHLSAQNVYCLQIIYLPDYSHPYVADITGGFGHTANSIALSNGWELLGINTHGKIVPAQPIRAMTAVPAMHGPHPMQMKKWHKGWKHHRGMGPIGRRDMKQRMKRRMMHRMMMSRHAAKAMGLKPGLYQFVFNARTGKLEGLKLVHLMHPGMKHHGWKRRHGKHHGHWHKHMMKKMMPATKTPATTPAV